MHELSAKELFAFLGHPNLTVRTLTTNRLVDAFPEDAALLASNLLSSNLRIASANDVDLERQLSFQASHAIWVLHRTVGVSQGTAKSLMQEDVAREAWVHLIKALGKTVAWEPWHFDAVRTAVTHEDAFVRRAAAEALSKHPDAQNVAPLLGQLRRTDPNDEQLVHQIRIAIRNQISSPEIASDLLHLPLSASERKQLVEFAATAPNGPAAALIIDEALHGRVSDELLLDALPAAAQYVDAGRLAALIDNVEDRFSSNPSARFRALEAIARAMAQDSALNEPLRGRISAMLRMAIRGDLDVDWHNTPLNASAPSVSPWTRQQRPSQQGGMVEVVSSLSAHGERAGGVLRSPELQLPKRMTFWMCGHNGLPSESDRQLNYVRLVLADGAEIARSYPPRDDVASRYEWDLGPYAGQRGRIEIVDGMTDRDGFAWLAVSSFEPFVAPLPSRAVSTQEDARLRLIELAGELKLTELQHEILVVATSVSEVPAVRLAATQSLSAFDPHLAIAPLSKLLGDADVPLTSRASAADQLGRINSRESRQSLLEALPSAPQPLAASIAASVTLDDDSFTSLVEMIEVGKASPRLLLEPVVQERLQSRNLPHIAEQIARLTDGVEPADARLANVIADRRAGYLGGRFDAEKGRGVFAKSICASCHRIGGVGSEIGPALDGIGNRGLDRLLEDTLDPNRNVDPAFRAVTILTDEGQAFSAFGVREEDEQLVFHDASGKEHRMPIDQAIERVPSTLSPMPANVADQLSAEDYFALLAYLLSLKQQ